MAYKWIENECYVQIEWVGRGSPRDAFQLPCYPQEVGESLSVTWNQQTVLGRTGSLFAYGGTSDTSCSFSFDAHMECYSAMMTNAYEWIEQNIDSSLSVTRAERQFELMIAELKAAAYPEYTGSGLHPPKVTFVFGAFKISGKLESISFQWKLPIINRKYAVATVSVQMSSAASKILSDEDILQTKPLVRGLHY